MREQPRHKRLWAAARSLIRIEELQRLAPEDASLALPATVHGVCFARMFWHLWPGTSRLSPQAKGLPRGCLGFGEAALWKRRGREARGARAQRLTDLGAEFLERVKPLL